VCHSCILLRVSPPTSSPEPLTSRAFRARSRRELRLSHIVALVVVPWVLANLVCAAAVSQLSGFSPWHGLHGLGDLVTFSLLTGWLGPVVVATSFGLYRAVRPPRNEPIQDAVLNGRRLTVSAPRALRLDLAAPFSAVVGVSGGRASLRVLADEGDVVLHAHVSDRVRDGGTLEPRPLDFSMAGVRAHQLQFGDALVLALRAAAPLNRYAEAVTTLDGIERLVTGDPAIAVVDADEEASRDYRTSARPRPGEAGYGSFVASEGHAVCSGVVIAGPHLVAQCTDGVRRAFPIGHVRADRVPGGLRASVESATFELALDVGYAEAIRVWLLSTDG
jgi:hypothetical protein